MNALDLLERTTVAYVALSGLLDGVNPCAFTTLVFLCSFLAFAGHGRREVALIGGLFTLGTFTTYLLLSLGLFQALLTMTAYRAVHFAFSLLVIPFTFLLAVLSVRDALLLERTGRGRELVLQLPARVRARIHALIRERLSAGRLGGGAMLLGVFIALFESLCTGQVLIPTLASLALPPPGLRASAVQVRALAYILIYNLAFIAPMLGVFGVTLAGLSSKRLSRLAKAHLPTARLLLGVLFFWFGVVLTLLFVKEWFP